MVTLHEYLKLRYDKKRFYMQIKRGDITDKILESRKIEEHLQTSDKKMNTTQRFIKLHKQASWTCENMLDSTNKSLPLTAERCWRRPSRYTRAELGALHAREGRECFTCIKKKKKICKLENPGDVCMGGKERESVCVCACTRKQHVCM